MLVASYHSFGLKAAEKAVETLLAGGSALDAVENGIKTIEDDPSVTSVGLNGLPNVLGEVELDAGIMDGRTRRACGVAAVKYVKHPISLARKCLELLPHALIVGEPAMRLAEALGLEMYRNHITSQEVLKRRDKAIREALKQGLQKYYDQIFREAAKIWHDTIGVIAVDAENNVAAGASTSGIPAKFPGRVSDSAIAGAGFYADNRYGAAICTGLGELAIRSSAAARAVFLLSRGYSAQEAAELVINDVAELIQYEGGQFKLGIVVASRNNIGAAALNWKEFKPIYWLKRMQKPEELKPSLVKT